MTTASTADYDSALWRELPSADGGLTIDGRSFGFVGGGVAPGAVVTVSEPSLQIPGTSALIRLALESSDSPERPAVVTESVTSLGELLVTSASWLVDEEGGTPTAVYRFVRFGEETTVMAEYIGDDSGLVPHIEELVARIGRTEPVGIGWSAPTDEWAGLAARGGVPAASSAAPAKAAPIVFGRTDAQVAAGVLHASAHGEAQAELTRIGIRDGLDRHQLHSQQLTRTVATAGGRRAVATAAVSIVAFATGFALVQGASDSNVTIALVGAVLVAASAVFLLVAELSPTVFAGTRTHMYGWPLFGALVVLAGWATVSVYRIIDGSYGWWGNVRPTFVLLIASIVVLLVGLVVARRNRASASALRKVEQAPESQTAAFAARETVLDERLRADITRALGSRAAAQIDRDVAVATLRDLVVSGKVSAARAEGILATIAG